jgi:hypothetical protein
MEVGITSRILLGISLIPDTWARIYLAGKDSQFFYDMILT